MLIRVRNSLGFLLAAAIGYGLASSTVSDVLSDLFHMAAVAMLEYRLRSGSGGTIWILAAGFFVGQTVVLATRRLILTLSPRATQLAEEAASWDAAFFLHSRFGVRRYLEACVKWVGRADSASPPSLALFKISGLGKLNDTLGTQVTTRLLQAIATELRASTLIRLNTSPTNRPTFVSRFSIWLARHLPPRRPAIDPATVVRCAGRWGGSTFALAFRALEVHEALTVVRTLASSIRSELARVAPEGGLELKVAFSMAPVDASAPAMIEAAEAALSAAEVGNLTVAVDPKDTRAGLLASVADLRRLDVSMAGEVRRPNPEQNAISKRARLTGWLRGWVPVLACAAGVPLTLSLGSGKDDFERTYPWPRELKSLSSIGPKGRTEIALVHQRLSEETGDGWRLSAGQVSQAEQGSGQAMVQVRLDVTNLSKAIRFASMFDFVAVDAAGNELEVRARWTLRLAEPLSGKWLDPGETWSGWLSLTRLDSAVKEVVFRPSTGTRIVVRAGDRLDPSPSAPQ